MRALVVGYGRMGGFHTKVLNDLGYTVTTVDPDQSRRADFTSLEEALPQATPWGGEPAPYDVAAVAVPPQYLVDTAYQLAGMPMLVEKPFALNVRDARMLSAYLDQQGSKVCVGLVERFNPQVRALRALLRDGTFRDVTSIRFTRWNDRPSFDVGLDLRLHDVDLMHFLRCSPDVSFETRADSRMKVRTIEVTYAEGTTVVDLMDHKMSPLHGLWHAFLTGGEYPKPQDVINALHVLPLTFEREAMAVAA